MLHIKTLDDGLEIFKALGSEVRIEIIKILLENHGMNMNELAGRLNVRFVILRSKLLRLFEFAKQIS